MSTSLALLAEQSLERLGDHDALLFEGTWHRSGDLAARAARLAGGLHDLGVRKGDRVLVCTTNCPEVVLAQQALWRLGAAPTPVLTAASPDELRHVLADSGAVAALVGPEAVGLLHRAGGNALPHAVIGQPSWTELEDAAPASVVRAGGRDLAALLYTGGTTGRAKGVALSHDNLWHIGRSRQAVVDAAGTARQIVPLPLAHVFGLVYAVGRLHLEQPLPLVLQRRFDARQWLELVAEHRVEGGAVVPSMLQLLLAQPLEDHDLTSLRHVSSGGAPLPASIATAFEARVPGCTVVDGYGCTEVTGTATMNLPSARRLGTVGQPVDGVSLKVVDDDGREVATGEDGEVLVAGPGTMLGYWRDPEATAEAVVDGWVRTGDVGHVDADGYLTVVDRRKDLVIRGGFNVYPRDVEEVLLQHPSVLAAAVVGRPDDVLGEEVVAFVQVSEPVDPAEVLAFAGARLGAHKRPRELRVVDVVPLTSVGKTDRKAVRRLLS